MTQPVPRAPLVTPAPSAQAPEAAPAAAVGRAMSRLAGLAGRPLAEHVDAFEHVHAALADALAAGAPDQG